MLAKCINESHRNWDEMAPLVVAALRASVHDVTQHTPNYLVLGRENKMAADIIYGIKFQQTYDSPDAYVSNLRNQLVNDPTSVSK